jgi:hypothetical protein
MEGYSTTWTSIDNNNKAWKAKKIVGKSDGLEQCESRKINDREKKVE